jgi:hypothetical protein
LPRRCGDWKGRDCLYFPGNQNRPRIPDVARNALHQPRPRRNFASFGSLHDRNAYMRIYEITNLTHHRQKDVFTALIDEGDVVEIDNTLATMAPRCASFSSASSARKPGLSTARYVVLDLQSDTRLAGHTGSISALRRIGNRDLQHLLPPWELHYSCQIVLGFEINLMRFLRDPRDRNFGTAPNRGCFRQRKFSTSVRSLSRRPPAREESTGHRE